MEIKHARIDNTTATVQLLRLACPKCREAVQFVIREDDRLYKKDAKYYEERCGDMLKEIHRLNGIIDNLVDKGK